MLSRHTYNDDHDAIHQPDSEVVSTNCIFQKDHFKGKKRELKIWKMKQRPKCFKIWSGRWESNPTPIAWKLLNILRFFSRLWNTLEHNRGYFLDCFAVSIPENVGIDPKSDAGICVP
jgi:hypothetical protein